MAELKDLSNELLLLVVSCLTTGDKADVQALLNVCLTSQRLCDIAQPALYTCARIPSSEPDPLKQLKIFLLSILQYPDLAEAPRELALNNDFGIGYEWPALQQDPYFMDLSASVVGHPNEIDPELCYRPLAIEALSRLPNLEHLHFTADIEPPYSLLQNMHRSQAEDSILSKLKTFHL